MDGKTVPYLFYRENGYIQTGRLIYEDMTQARNICEYCFKMTDKSLLVNIMINVFELFNTMILSTIRIIVRMVRVANIMTGTGLYIMMVMRDQPVEENNRPC